MGCTSSAPNTVSANANTADKSIQIEEDATIEEPSSEVAVAATESENRNNDTKVLPQCDNFEEPVQLVRNNKSKDSLLNEKDVPANGHINESEDTTDVPEKTHEINNITKMELLMDKVFAANHHLNVTEHRDNETDPPAKCSDPIETVASSNEGDKVDTVPLESNDDLAETGVENNTEATQESEEPSPSQSQSSRATRWEALADIAAELPPSLAVDPLTGQIYSLTK